MRKVEHPAFARLRARLERSSRRRARASDPKPPPQVLVDAPGLRFDYGDLNRRYHCASVDKVMIAVLVGRLVERGRLGFDAPLGQVLPRPEVVGLPAADGVDPARDITVDHLLSHTSGLPDWFDPPRGQDVGVSLSQVVRKPEHRWSRAEILDQARTMRAVGRPGQRFVYSDTAYLLVTRILEPERDCPCAVVDAHSHTVAWPDDGEYLPPLFRGLPEPVGGLGVSASHLFYYPSLGANVVLNFHATRAMNASFQTHLQIARALQTI